MSEAETQAAAILDRMYARGMNAKEFAIELAAAEERGRRRGVEERDELRTLLIEAQAIVALQAARNPVKHNIDLLARIDLALAPRDSAPATEASDG